MNIQELKELLQQQANVQVDDVTAGALLGIVANYPVTAVKVAQTFTEAEIKEINEAIKVVNKNTEDAGKMLKAYAILGKLVALLPVV